MQYHHVSVMLKEVVDNMNCRPGKIYVDCTLGGSGHAGSILERILPTGRLIGIDQDHSAINNAATVLKPYAANIHLVHDNFVNLREILYNLNIATVDGILLDLGMSSHHLNTSGRGFSFNKEEPLDMRMDKRESQTAFDVIHTKSEAELTALFKTYGEEPRAGRISREIIKKRQIEPIRTSRQLAEIIINALPPKVRYGKRIHPATRVFMALRIAVNRELERLEAFMGFVSELMNPPARLCVISFHSLEDRIVKQHIRNMENPCTCPKDFPKCVCGKKGTMKNLTRKAIIPSAAEIKANPLSRSAKLRVAEKL